MLARHRVWIAALILGLTTGLVLYDFYAPGVDDGLRFPFVCLALLLGAVLLNVWFLFLGRFSLRVRGIGLLVQLLIVVLWNVIVRVDGWTGDMYPILAVRFSPLPEARAASRTLPAAPTQQIQLTSTGHDFPRFLGPAGDGRVTDCGLEPDWKTRPPREVWRTPVGLGWSAFAVVGDYALTQEQLGQNEVVTCRRAATGEVVWSHSNPGRFSEWMGGDGPRATPTVDGGDVYVMGAFGLLQRLDGSTGNPQWTRDILKDFGATNQTWAKSCSPLLVDNLVIVTLGETPVKPSLAAYDRRTGARVWAGGDDKAAYGTPRIAEVAGRRQVLVCNASTVSGHDPLTGQTLWTSPIPGQMAKCSDVVPLPGDRIFTSAGYGTGAILLRIVAEGASFRVEKEWANTRILRTRFTNVVVRDQYLFGLDDSTLQCVEVQTGKSLWRKGRYGQGQVLLADDLLIVQAEQGDVVLVAADPQEHRELGRIAALKAKTWNTSSLAGNLLFVRNAEEAVCYELPLRQQGAP